MTSFIDLARPSNKVGAYSYDFLSILTGSLFIALLSQVSIPLWFSPIPFTLQSFAILLVGAFLGRKKGSLAVLAYLAEAFMGFPVLAGGASGPLYFFGPTGGYLLGFVACTYLVGLFLEKGARSQLKWTLVALIIGAFSILSLGTLWLSYYVGFKAALAFGFYPFLAAESAKLMVATLIIRGAFKLPRL